MSSTVAPPASFTYIVDCMPLRVVLGLVWGVGLRGWFGGWCGGENQAVFKADGDEVLSSRYPNPRYPNLKPPKPAPGHAHQVRREADLHVGPRCIRQPLLDLRHVPVAGDPVGVDALCDLSVEVGLLRGAAGAGDAWFGVWGVKV